MPPSIIRNRSAVATDSPQSPPTATGPLPDARTEPARAKVTRRGAVGAVAAAAVDAVAPHRSPSTYTAPTVANPITQRPLPQQLAKPPVTAHDPRPRHDRPRLHPPEGRRLHLIHLDGQGHRWSHRRRRTQPRPAPGPACVVGRHPRPGRRDRGQGNDRLDRRPAQPPDRRPRHRDGLLGDHPVAHPQQPDLGRAGQVLPRQHRRRGLRRHPGLPGPRDLVQAPAARGDGGLLDQPPRRHRPMGRRVGQRAPLPPRRDPPERPRPVLRHAGRGGQAPRDAAAARQRVLHQAVPQRELRP